MFEGALFWSSLAVMIITGLGGPPLTVFMAVAVLMVYVCVRISKSKTLRSRGEVSDA